MTLPEIKDYLFENFEDGVDCPACSQHVQKYKYKLFSSSAVALVDLFVLTEKTKEDYHHISKFAEARDGKPRASHFAELRFWGLAVPMDRKTAEKNSSGMWSITKKGRDFVQQKISVQKYVTVFNNTFLGFEGETINIVDALENKFDYNEVIGEYAFVDEQYTLPY